MYCIQCGKQISDQAVFCRYCGSKQTDDKSYAAGQTARLVPPVSLTPPPPVVTQIPVTPPPVAPPFSAAPQAPYIASGTGSYAFPSHNAIPDPGKYSYSPVRIIFGILLILGGILPYLLLTGNTSFLSRMTESIYAYDSLSVAAYSAVVGCVGIFEKLLSFPAHMFSLISGIILLQSQRRHKGLLIANGIFHLLTALYYALVPVISEAIFASYTSNSNLSGLPIISMLWENTLPNLALVLVVAALSFTVLFFKLPNAQLRKERCGSCLFIMMPFWGLMVLASSLETVVLANFMGSARMAAYSSVNALLNSQFGSYVFLFFVALIAVSIALRKFRFHWFALIAGGILLIGCAFFSDDAPLQYLSSSLISYAMDIYSLLYWGNALMLLATALWIIAATRNCVPLWLQWLLCVSLFPLRILVSFTGVAIFGLTAANIGQYACVIVILITSVTAGLVSIGKSRNPK